MYQQFYGLTDRPFTLTPNPRFVFYSQRYREAESQLLYGINAREGFMIVTGQPGTGKTTLRRDLIRVLSNLETDQEKLILIVLVGQPELFDNVRTPAMAQLDQRVSIRCTLRDLELEETDRYIHHRLNVAGARGQIRFSARAIA